MNPMPTRTPVANHSMRQTRRVTDFCGVWSETVESNHAERKAITLPHSPRTAVLNGAVPKSRIEAARET